MNSKKNSWAGPKQLGIAIFCGILFLAVYLYEYGYD